MNAEVVTYQYHFGEYAVNVFNTATEGKMEIGYDAFSKYQETEHYAILITKAKQYIAFNKEIAKEKDIKGFVKSKNQLLKVL